MFNSGAVQGYRTALVQSDIVHYIAGTVCNKSNTRKSVSSGYPMQRRVKAVLFRKITGNPKAPSD